MNTSSDQRAEKSAICVCTNTVGTATVPPVRCSVWLGIHGILNRSTRDWYTHAATFVCSSAAMFSTAAVTAGS